MEEISTIEELGVCLERRQKRSLKKDAEGVVCRDKRLRIDEPSC